MFFLLSLLLTSSLAKFLLAYVDPQSYYGCPRNLARAKEISAFIPTTIEVRIGFQKIIR
jgi:hypothetical protein